MAPDDEEKTAGNVAGGTGEGEKPAADTGEGAGEKGPTRTRRSKRQGRREQAASAADAAAASGAGGDGGEDGGVVSGAGLSEPVRSNTEFGAVGCPEEPKTPLGRPGGECENWDLCLVVDPVTKDQEAAQAEVESFFSLLRKEGLTVTDPLPMDPNAGFTGEVMALCTASQVYSAFEW